MRNAVTSQLAGPVRRIALASALIVVLFAATTGVIVLRLDASANKYETIVAVQPSSFTTSDTRTSLYDILNAVRRYDLSPTAANGETVADFRSQLGANLDRLASVA